MSVSKTAVRGSNPRMRANALVVQWIRTLDYESRDSGSNPLESTEWLVWSRRPLGLQILWSWFDTNTNLETRSISIGLDYAPWKGEVAGSSPVFSTNGLACTKAGEVALQATCEEFDSLLVHK